MVRSERTTRRFYEHCGKVHAPVSMLFPPIDPNERFRAASGCGEAEEAPAGEALPSQPSWSRCCCSAWARSSSAPTRAPRPATDLATLAATPSSGTADASDRAPRRARDDGPRFASGQARRVPRSRARRPDRARARRQGRERRDRLRARQPCPARRLDRRRARLLRRARGRAARARPWASTSSAASSSSRTRCCRMRGPDLAIRTCGRLGLARRRGARLDEPVRPARLEVQRRRRRRGRDARASTRSCSTTSASRRTATWTCRLPQQRSLAKREAIPAFLRYAKRRLEPLGVRISAAVFGLSAARDLGIGQIPRRMAPHLDTVYAMTYPVAVRSGRARARRTRAPRPARRSRGRSGGSSSRSAGGMRSSCRGCRTSASPSRTASTRSGRRSTLRGSRVRRATCSGTPRALYTDGALAPPASSRRQALAAPAARPRARSGRGRGAGRRGASRTRSTRGRGGSRPRRAAAGRRRPRIAPRPRRRARRARRGPRAAATAATPTRRAGFPAAASPSTPRLFAARSPRRRPRPEPGGRAPTSAARPRRAGSRASSSPLRDVAVREERRPRSSRPRRRTTRADGRPVWRRRREGHACGPRDGRARLVEPGCELRDRIVGRGRARPSRDRMLHARLAARGGHPRDRDPHGDPRPAEPRDPRARAQRGRASADRPRAGRRRPRARIDDHGRRRQHVRRLRRRSRRRERRPQPSAGASKRSASRSSASCTRTSPSSRTRATSSSPSGSARSSPIGGETRAAFFNAGAEAVENAVKLARLYTRRQGVIAFEGAFHGRTWMALTMTSKTHPYKKGLGPFAPEVYRAPYPERLSRPGRDDGARRARAAVHDARLAGARRRDRLRAAAGRGRLPPRSAGVRRRAAADLRRARDRARRGRGADRLRANRPDVRDGALRRRARPRHRREVDRGRPAALGRGRPRGDHGRTRTPGRSAGRSSAIRSRSRRRCAVLDVFEEEQLVERAQLLGEALRARMLDWQSRWPRIGDVRGLGAMLAIELVRDPATKEPAPELAEAVVDEALAARPAAAQGRRQRQLHPRALPADDLGRRARRRPRCLGRGARSGANQLAQRSESAIADSDRAVP